MKNTTVVGSHVPGRIEAENYGHEGLSKSFFVKDTAKNAESYCTSEPGSTQIRCFPQLGYQPVTVKGGI